MTRKRLVVWSVVVGVVLCLSGALAWRTRELRRRAAEADIGWRLWRYLGAQNQFHRQDHYGLSYLVYANPGHGTGFPDLYRVGGPDGDGPILGLIPEVMARATSPETAFGGYYFEDVAFLDYTIDCGLRAIEVRNGQIGRKFYEIDAQGPVFASARLKFACKPPEYPVPEPKPQQGWVALPPSPAERALKRLRAGKSITGYRWVLDEEASGAYIRVYRRVHE